ncbi:MAG: Gfo/Idh/MocA family oxidoreductase [Lentisphaerae bacterium]|nr:Gfo/Idh/MocA family oxidoreductase [Lentisphaerota bacterium]
MLRIGIIGAENSHAAAIGRLINVERKIKGARVEYIWGETHAFANAAAKAGGIPHMVRNPGEMLGRVDAVVVDHRDPRPHLKAALPFVREGLPVFIDKPFCYRAAEGKRFLKTARSHGAAVTSFSVLPEQAAFRAFRRGLPKLGAVLAGAAYGPCDPYSRYGGLFFYGIHQVDLALHAFGYAVRRVLMTRNGNGATGQLFYPDGRIVTLNFIAEGFRGFALTAAGERGTLHRTIDMDASPYLRGVRTLVKMFKTGEAPLADEALLRPIQVLEALERSLKSGAIEKIV